MNNFLQLLKWIIYSIPIWLFGIALWALGVFAWGIIVGIILVLLVTDH